MTKKFATSLDVSLAIRELFGDERIGLGFLEVHDQDSAGGLGESATVRAARLRDTLESYIVNMARESKELGEADQVRLQAEARATLIALRELFASFPEVARER